MQMMTIAEAAKALGVHVKTLRRWADDGRVPVTRLPSGLRRWTPAQVREIHEMMNCPVVKVAV